MNPLSLLSLVFNEAFFKPTINLLIVMFHWLQSWGVPGAMGLSIILLTIVIRLVVWPFMAVQLKSSKKMAELKPHLDVLKSKHKGDRQALSKAQMELYKEHGVNPAAGCLPTLIQFPVLIALYQAVFALVDTSAGLDKINQYLYNPSWYLSSAPDLHFLGMNLAVTPSQFTTLGVWLLLVPVVTAVLQLLQSRMMMPEPVKKYPSDSPKEKKEKETTEDTMAAVQTQMMYMMPLMIGYFAFQFPIALALYWNVMTILGIVQQYMVSGWGGLKSWMPSSLTR